jgi:hypothetical protein
VAVAWRDSGPRDYQLLKMVAVSYSPAADPGFVRTVSQSDTLRLAQMPITIPSPTGSAGRAPGLYVQVLDGLIHLSNPAGSQTFSAGQFGFTPNVQAPPVIVPMNPGIKFIPPPSFGTSGGPSGTSSAPKSNAVDCVVR